jgi:hypothetical protein
MTDRDGADRRYTLCVVFPIWHPALNDRTAIERRMADELRARCAADGFTIPEGRLTSFRIDWNPEGHRDYARVIAETWIAVIPPAHEITNPKESHPC